MQRARWSSIACRCHSSRTHSILRSPPTGVWASRRTCTPRISFRWRTWNTAARLPTRITLFGADVGQAGGTAARRAGTLRDRGPLAWRFRPTNRVSTSPARARNLSRSSTFRACCVLFTRHTGSVCAGSFGQRELRCRRASRGPRSARRGVHADGRKLLVANRLDDTISVIDTHNNRVAATIDLEGPKKLSVLRHGEQTFYTSRYSFQGQIGCANCHIDSTFDGLTWDLEPDGFGRDIVDNRLLEDVKETEPYKWNGGNPNLPTECGPRTEKYFWRSENYDDLALTDLVVYIRSLPARPNRWRLPGRRTDPGAGARQGYLRAQRSTSSGSRFRRPTSAPIATADPRAPARNHLTSAREANRQLGTARHAAADQYRAHRSLSARWLGAHPGGDLDGLQSRRQARPHQRPDQGRAERPDRVPEDAMKSFSRVAWMVLAAAALRLAFAVVAGASARKLRAGRRKSSRRGSAVGRSADAAISI